MHYYGWVIPQTQRAGSSRIFAFLTLAIAAYVTFAFPFHFPPKTPSFGESYQAGFDNRVATIGLGVISVIVFLFFWRRGSKNADQITLSEGNRLQRNEAILAVVATIAGTLLFGFFALHKDPSFAEAAFFIGRARDLLVPHMHIYQQVEFPYGPLMIEPLVYLARLLSPLHIPFTTIHLLLLAAEQSLGVLLAVYTLNRLPLSYRWRLALLVFLVVAQLNPLLGANYSLYKFGAPMALLIYGMRRSTAGGALLALTLANLLLLLLSPELAIGSFAATATYGIICAMQGDRRRLVTLASPVIALAVFLAIFGLNYFQRLGAAAGGALNLIVQPTPNWLVFVFAVAWLIPRFAGELMHSRTAESRLLVPCYVLGIGLIPGALGRSDAVHLLFNGIAIFLLSAVAVSTKWHQQDKHSWQQKAWGLALAVVLVQMMGRNLLTYRNNFKEWAHPTPHQISRLDIRQLNSIVGNDPVASPVSFPVYDHVEDDLRASGHYVVDYYPALGEVWVESAERRKIEALRKQKWAVVYQGDWKPVEFIRPDKVLRYTRFGIVYHPIRPPYAVGNLLDKEIQEHWTLVARFGEILLYRNEQQVP